MHTHRTKRRFGDQKWREKPADGDEAAERQNRGGPGETKLYNENYNIESEFIEKLKDMEKKSVYLEVSWRKPLKLGRNRQDQGREYEAAFGNRRGREADSVLWAEDPP